MLYDICISSKEYLGSLIYYEFPFLFLFLLLPITATNSACYLIIMCISSKGILVWCVVNVLAKPFQVTQHRCVLRSKDGTRQSRSQAVTHISFRSNLFLLLPHLLQLWVLFSFPCTPQTTKPPLCFLGACVVYWEFILSVPTKPTILVTTSEGEQDNREGAPTMYVL